MYVRGRRMGKHLYWAGAGTVIHPPRGELQFSLLCENLEVRTRDLCVLYDLSVTVGSCESFGRGVDMVTYIVACQLDGRGTVIAAR